MPKRKRQSYKGRSSKRRKPTRKRFGRRAYVPRGLRSQKKIVKVRWVHYNSLNPGTGTIDFHAYRANSIHHPDGTGSDTHSPMWVDQLATAYNHYVVLGSKITMKIIPNFSSTTVAMGTGGIFLSDDTTFSTNLNTLTEQNRSRFKFIAPVHSLKPTTVTSKFSAKKFFNIKDVKDNVLRIGSPFGANPNEQAHFVTWVGCVDPTVDQATYSTYVIIDYIVLVSEPKEIAQS